MRRRCKGGEAAAPRLRSDPSGTGKWVLKERVPRAGSARSSLRQHSTAQHPTAGNETQQAVPRPAAASCLGWATALLTLQSSRAASANILSAAASLGGAPAYEKQQLLDTYTGQLNSRFSPTAAEASYDVDHFEWPLARAAEAGEAVTLTLLQHSRYFGRERALGAYSLLLQQVLRDGRLALCDTMLDSNNKPLPTRISFEIAYTPPGGAEVAGDAVFDALDDDQQMLIDIEQNIANLERNLQLVGRRGSWQSDDGGGGRGARALRVLRRGTSLTSPTAAAPDKSPAPERKRSSTLKSVRSLMRLGKQRPSRHDSDGEEGGEARQRLLSGGDSAGDARSLGGLSRSRSRPGSQTSLSSGPADADADAPTSPAGAARSRPRTPLVSASPHAAALKAQDFQLCVTVIEARQLAGLNMDPVVCVQVGDQRKYTSVKESTNCPYYNEYFVFDFHMPPIMLFDKIITLSVLQSRNILRSNKMLGSFKLDVATVWAQPDHQFYHKWALLTDPDDIAGGPKGYLKCDIAVIGKGDSIKVPPKSEKDEDDIEANLLLPDGVPVERQRARFIVRIYRADGLPKMNSSIVANVKKAFTGEFKDLVDPYVQVSFAGLTGKTSVKKHSYAPVWNEQIVFTEMFPPLCQRIKIQLRDNDPVNNTVIGTHFIDLKTISNDGEKGFLPTFGPTFIHLYGSTRDYSLIDEHSNLNSGLGEGVSYRARLLVAIRTEITDTIDLAPSEVEVEPTFPINESSYAKNEEFFLFATILEATMIDKKLGDKPVYFELSIGNAGNSIDGHNETAKDFADSDSDDNLEVVTSELPSWQSTTPPAKPMTHDRIYYFLPYWDDKPCMHVYSIWPDHRRRMYNSNIIAKIIDKLEEGLSEVQLLTEQEDGAAERRLRAVLEELSAACARYVSIARSNSATAGMGKTKLDKERIKLCQRDVEHIGVMSRNLKALVTKNSLKERYKTAHTYLQKLKFLVEDPQHSMPDIFVWIISGGKRIAYQRIQSRNLIHSIVDEECGRDCGKVQTLFLRLPGKKGVGPSGWAIQSKLQMYMWLGILKHKKNCFNGLPKGYEISHEIRNAERPRALPPSVIHYLEKYSFQLRAHMYQARSLIGSDASGLSDPFARVVIGEYCKVTQVIDETLSPTWDELLVFDEILVFGTKEEIKNDPPSIIIEIFDQDKVGKSEFIGRTVARPHVKLVDEPYSKPNFPPSLEWYELMRGPDHAGELLATFELLELGNMTDPSVLPQLPEPKEATEILGDSDTGPMLPVPRGIRPTLAKYRIEVLFWGLRDLKRVHLMTVDKPRVDIECAGHILYSSVIQNARKNPNFSTPVKFLELELPEQELYRPPLTIRAVDCRSFGRYTLVGTHMINSIHKYMYVPMTKREREAEERKKSLQQLQNMDPNSSGQQGGNNLVIIDNDNKENSPLLPKDMPIILDYGTGHIPSKKDLKTEANRKRKQSIDEADNDESNRDWWTKYFASVEAMIEESKEHRKEVAQMHSQQNGSLPIYFEENSGFQPSNRDISWTGSDRSTEKKKHTLKGTSTAAKFVARLSPKSMRRRSELQTAIMKIYPNELEMQPEYNGFKEWLLTFDLYRGKKTGDDTEDESRVVGTFKGAIKVYKWPLPKDIEDHTIMGFDPQYGFFQGLPSNDPIHVLVRVYIVKATDLHPMDLNGKADPYIVLQLGNKRISDKENYISKQLNPVFGKCFEFEATFPQDSMLTIQIFDWDLVGSDDLIGETRIDLENRFYSRHRATCGIAQKYEEYGYNQWRDPMKPTQILAKLCKDGKIDSPSYSPGKVKVGRQVFCLQSEDPDVNMSTRGMEEHMALAVLHRWHEFPRIGCQLVPEHIETRPLYHVDKPGIEQGKLEMWVDMFPMDMPLPGPSLDISPRKPKSYELRIIIWNTDDVVLEDDAFFTGEKMSDIYVKGWLKGQEDCQCTDIHYRSLTGEGNFNWRFIYPFDYLVAEEKIVISRKESLFSWDETECKIPARLELQVWDADHFSADDFLGAITLDLNRFPRGAKSSKLCTLDMLKTDGSVPMVNIFKQKRVKGWWPFYVKKENEEMELTGKVEAEIHLLTKEEAEKNPAGLGRNEPDPLDKPNRPDASFMWFLNPLKSIRYIVWHNYKWAILKILVILALAVVLLLFFYSVPGYTVKKMLGA
ncbi:otoferlin-like [Schistocerca piceifrons]|uniref:otoferlin-like n=1 Tax=Schistocerca piceifrons TaxID=274613 RepID=UPI001F5F2754|nr:otoferlin-like [Schistocerca piceifrons]